MLKRQVSKNKQINHKTRNAFEQVEKLRTCCQVLESQALMVLSLEQEYNTCGDDGPTNEIWLIVAECPLHWPRYCPVTGEYNFTSLVESDTAIDVQSSLKQSNHDKFLVSEPNKNHANRKKEEEIESESHTWQQFGIRNHHRS